MEIKVKLNINRKKLRFGGIALALTAFIIAAVVLLNVLFMALASSNRWYIDMTTDALYSLSDECRDLVKNAIEGENGVNAQREKYNKDNGLNPGDEGYQEEAKVTIYFCDDPDILSNTNDYMRYVYNTALDLDEACDFINIDYLNWEYNPTSVQKYMAMGNNINSSSIIVESGTEYRVFTLQSMFIVNEEDVVWAYDGEKKLAGAILGVTAVDQPIAYITTSHGESFYDTSLFELLQDAGYKIAFEGGTDIDGNVITPKLTDKETNPLDPESGVRLVVIYNPTSDFQTAGTSEIDRLDRFLEENKSLMVFMDPYSPILSDFEEWLATWGIRFDRYAVGNDYYSYMIKDSTASLDSAGYAVKANYVTSGGIGKSIYSQFIDNGRTPPVYFDKAMSISYTFETVTQGNDDDQSKDFTYGYKYTNGVTKEIFDMFTAPSSAVAVANGTTVATSGSGNPMGQIEYIYRDSQGNIYKLNATKDKIVDADGNVLQNSGDSTDVFLAADGTELVISGATIVEKNLAAGAESGSTAIVTEIIEFSGKKYKLSQDGTQILDENGNALKADEQSGLYITADGSYLAIETIGDAKSIKVHRGAQSSANPFKFMTITRRHDTVQVNNYQTESQDAYLLACGSTAYATEKYLKSAVYGNANVLMAATTLMGREVVPVGIDFKPFDNLDISDITDAEANSYTLLLTLIPPVIVIGVGIVVLVRRKYS